MRLRNKKTGEIGRLYFDHQLIDPKTGTYAIVIQHRDKLGYEAFANYFTLTKLNEDWEDYKPAEPLIKDEKIRKAVRAWAEACEIESDDAIMLSDLAPAFTRFYTTMYEIDIKTESSLGLDGHRDYTIDELCGKEEEC